MSVYEALSLMIAFVV
ncbi:putative holin-like toxin [Streptococcus marmotae]